MTQDKPVRAMWPRGSNDGIRRGETFVANSEDSFGIENIRMIKTFRC